MTYVVHIKKLNEALNHGLRLKKVHRVVRCEQSDRIKAYIMLNTKLEFKKDLLRLMNNSVFEKTMGNIKNHRDMKLTRSRKKYAKYVIKPNFKDVYPFSKELFFVEMEKTEIKINKPQSFS